MAADVHSEVVMTVAPVGKVRSPWAVIGLTIVTLGIYSLYWLYAMYQEQLDHSGEGTNGVVGLVLGILVFPVTWFLLPYTIGQTYERAGQERACSAVTGFWNLLPILGGFIWLFRVQNSMNRYWETRI